jgi:CRP-like cAMP-binding protein
MDETLEHLRHCPVLKDFSDVGLQILSAVVRPRLYANSQSLQTQGEPPRDAGVLFIATGRARCEVRDSENKILGLGTLEPGDHLGGMRLFGEIPSPLSVVAEGDVTGLLLDKPAFARLQQQKPQAAMKLLFALTQDFGQRLSEAGNLFTDFAQFAARRANMAERGTFASYEELGLAPTPMANLANLRGY